MSADEALDEAVILTQALLRIPSVTPDAGEAVAHLQGWLEAKGFRCARPDRNGVPNLFARYGEGRPAFAFNGHLDVVPPGGGWTRDPWGAELEGGRLYGRGAADMKSGVAAFAVAAARFLAATPDFGGSILLTITGDEEGPSVDGTPAILDWMAAQGERPDHCLVGEPTCPARMGEMMKIGRRGSVTFALTARGAQGHAAYPHRARNPIPPLMKLLDRLASEPLDAGTAHFEPSTLSIVTVDVGNPADNVIPAEARAKLNIRFNDAHTADSLHKRIEAAAAEIFPPTGVDLELTRRVSGVSFVTEPGPFTALIRDSVEAATGLRPELSTSGGTSDARYMQAVCPTAEFGLVGATLHKADEWVEAAHVVQLAEIYQAILERYFQSFRAAS
ncbi:succinyl-diaminopimelate desuccinylase [Neomegalonema perideroedes]|uniref:succinyl-diaminopimelate desuccinylase n=1 Tax=Neomegalonema perideroedes TaxID=217219 RepID=UPI000361DF2E|nr:succinyl-diaminopimelate desuccinylase [Neomegalonema perideroedes]